jgi:hypothetical protein
MDAKYCQEDLVHPCSQQPASTQSQQAAGRPFIQKSTEGTITMETQDNLLKRNELEGASKFSTPTCHLQMKRL